MHRGYVYIWRKVLESEWYQDSNTIRLYFHCVLKANFTNKTWKGIEIQKGSFITSIDTLKGELGITFQQVRTSLAKLEKSKNVTSKATNKFTILTVCNYETYQDKNTYDNKQVNNQITNKQQTNNKQVTTTNNANNANNANKEKTKGDKSPDAKKLAKYKLKMAKCLEHDYFKNDAFSDLWNDWKDSKGKKYTLNAQNLQLGRLFEWELDTCIDALTYSVCGGYMMVYKDKSKQSNSNNQPEKLTWKQKQKKMFADEIKRLADEKAVNEARQTNIKLLEG